MDNYASSPILLFGKHGQLARAFQTVLKDQVVALSHDEADFLYPELIEETLHNLPFRPRAIINAMAYTAVDKAESEEEREAVFCINATTPEVIGQYCKKHHIPMLHYSSDYVFDGSGTQPWTTESTPDPLNVYGASKLLGEIKLTALQAPILIIRTSWVFDGMGKNFFTTMLRLGQEREKIAVVSDQIGAPTYAPHLAKASRELLTCIASTSPPPYGIYHLCNTGETSWFGFAEEIFLQARQCEIPLTLLSCEPILTSDYPTPAKRPFNSRLDCSRARVQCGIALPHWKDAVKEAIQERTKQ